LGKILANRTIQFKRNICFSEIEKIVTENSNFGFSRDSYGFFQGNVVVGGSVVQRNNYPEGDVISY
jgi:hypothetical protein